MYHTYQRKSQPCLKQESLKTTDGIQDEITVVHYDHMQRGLRDGGHLPVDDVKRNTNEGDHALEIGPGPGYYGLEWLKKTNGTKLTGLEISPAMIRLAEKKCSRLFTGLTGNLPRGKRPADAISH